MKKLKIAAIGCGNRVRIYTALAAQQPDLYEIVAAADPNNVRLDAVKRVSNNPDFKSFSSDRELLAEDRLADVMIIGTQDNHHYEPCRAALLKGYNVLLEKPIAPRVEEILELQELAETLGRKLQV
ncbi:MAG TPA: Gfo/Idh/MocA family oxidoreductase, partial [Tichowtungia sp.]|nr:Gfo/Idh/MocA family oxidoreductase [Tichowtungia sp.]